MFVKRVYFLTVTLSAIGLLCFTLYLKEVRQITNGTRSDRLLLQLSDIQHLKRDQTPHNMSSELNDIIESEIVEHIVSFSTAKTGNSHSNSASTEIPNIKVLTSAHSIHTETPHREVIKPAIHNAPASIDIEMPHREVIKPDIPNVPAPRIDRETPHREVVKPAIPNVPAPRIDTETPQHEAIKSVSADVDITSRTPNAEVKNDNFMLSSYQKQYYDYMRRKQVRSMPEVYVDRPRVFSTLNIPRNNANTEWKQTVQHGYESHYSSLPERTLQVVFPKPTLLFSHIPCTMENTTDVKYLPSKRERDSPELQVVVQNLHKCLAASELTDYFNSRNYTATSVSNAALLLSLMRDMVPARHSAVHSTKSCWKSDLNLTVCTERMIEGYISGFPFHFLGTMISLDMQKYISYSHSSFKIHSTEMCLPSIFVAGFPKCGSSFVYCLIRKLFQVNEWKYPMDQPEKEPHFWVPRGPHTNNRRLPLYGDFATYMLNFIPRVYNDNMFSLPIDASPNLLFQWPRYSQKETLENVCLLPAVLTQILPQNKYVIVLRNPVTMLYSAFWFSSSTFCRTLNHSQQESIPNDFHRKVVKKIKTYRHCSVYNPVDVCLDAIFPVTRGIFDYSSPKCGRVRLEVGFYYYHIRRWLAVIPREQFFFVTIEDLHSKITVESQRLSDFLGLNMQIFEQSIMVDSKCMNVQSLYDYRNDPALQMRDDTKQLLYKFFEPFNQKLAELLKDPKYTYLWKL